jgi:hypothetical protein
MSNQERVAERRKHWGELIARQQQSGKTVKAFCEENGVGGPSFYAWRKRLKGKIQPVGFALVETAAGGPSARSGDGVDLLSSGERLQIGSRAQRRAVIERVFSSNEGLGSGLK